MKKVVLLLCTILVLYFVGCGNTNQSNDVSDLSSTVVITNASDTQGEKVNKDSILESSTDNSMDETLPESNSYEPTTEISGIIMVQQYRATSNTSGAEVRYVLMAIDPDTGDMHQIAEFSVWATYGNKSDYFIVPQIGRNNSHGGNRRLFSEDFSKMAVTLYLVNKSEMHAGWIDQEGNFFDVTEAIGEGSTAFGAPVHCVAVGFTEDDLFVYNDNGDQWTKDTFHYIDINMLTTSYDGNPLENDIGVSVNGYYRVTGRLDDTYSLIDDYDPYIENSFIINTETGEKTRYIPGDTRSNWSGVASPDGELVAFLSVIKDNPNWMDETQIFIVPPWGDAEPQVVNCNIRLDPNRHVYTWALLEWN